MNQVNLISFTKDIVQHTISCIERNLEPGLNIADLDVGSIAQSIIDEKSGTMRIHNFTKVSWLLSYIESDRSLEESIELEVLSEKLKDGYTSGYDKNESGQYLFDIYTHGGSYSHMYSIAFELTSGEEDGEDVTPAMLQKAIERRLKSMSRDEIQEACGGPEDTYDKNG